MKQQLLNKLFQKTNNEATICWQERLNDLNETLPANIEADINYTGIKLSSQLSNVKDPTPFKEQHHLIYRSVGNNDNCNDDHI